MKRTDGSKLLNSIYAINVLNEGTTATESDLGLHDDYSNLADFGAAISANDPHFEGTVNGMIDKVGKTEYQTGTFTSVAPPVLKDSTGWANMLEVVNIDVGEYSESLKYSILEGDVAGNTQNSFEDLFGSESPSVSCKYYNSKVDYRNKITFPDKQVSAAFKDASEMDRFYSAIEARVNQKKQKAEEVFQFLAFDSMVLGACLDEEGNRKQSNIFALETDTNDSLDAKSIAQLNDLIDQLKIYSSKFSGFATSTGQSDLRIAIDSKLYNKFIASKSGVHHPEFLNIPFENITTLPYFQYIDNPTTIKGRVQKNKEGDMVVINNVIAVIWHDKACGLYNPVMDTSSQRVPNRWMTNFFHCGEYMVTVNDDLPCIIITKSGANDMSITHQDSIPEGSQNPTKALVGFGGVSPASEGDGEGDGEES